MGLCAAGGVCWRRKRPAGNPAGR
ncbi:hypothetical protein [Agrobacterium tumefaciens]